MGLEMFPDSNAGGAQAKRHKGNFGGIFPKNQLNPLPNIKMAKKFSPGDLVL